jgi:glutamate dehydrogenase
MTTTAPEARDELAPVLALAHERLPADQAGLVARFLSRYYARVAADDLAERDPLDLYGAAMRHWRLGASRSRGQALVEVVNPDVDEHGWQSPHTVLDVVVDDMPFLVDSVTITLERLGCGLHLVVHPLLDVTRDEGVVVALGDGTPTESWMHVELDRQSRPERRAAIEEAVLTVLAQVRAAVEDWPAMRARAVAVADRLEARPGPSAPGRAAEAVSLVRWLADDHFTFLGHRAYDVTTDGGQTVLRPEPGSGLGLLRPALRPPHDQPLTELAPDARARALDADPLIVTRANSRSPVHRNDFLVYVGVKQFDEGGAVVGEDRFLGLYTALAYRASASEIPFLRSKIDAVIDRSGFPRQSHSGRELWNILETFPREDLFQIDVDELQQIATGILNLQERKQVRLFARRDSYGRFVSCLVYLPRERYSTTVIEEMGSVLLHAYGGEGVEHETLITESVLARVQYLVRLGRGAPVVVDTVEVERRLGAVTRWWIDDLRTALVEAVGEEQGLAELARFEQAFPASYREAYSARAAVNDIHRITRLGDGEITTALHQPVEAAPAEWRFKLYTPNAVTLSAVLPVLEHLGAEVTDERPFEIRPDGAPSVWLYDMGLRCPHGERFADERVREEFRSAFAAVWRGAAESDGFDRLVLSAGLSHRQVTVLRAYAKYLRQIGITFSAAYLAEALARHPEVTHKLVELFDVRFAPDHQGHRSLEAAGIGAEVAEALDRVASLDDDRILRAFLGVIEATTRTNAFRPAADGGPRPVLSFKLDPSRVPDLPLPKPRFEIWVYSPRVEGVHLRGGPVARGGLRWSDRREDFRTEVLGLMKAQMVKNAVIVPVGAKGGFVVKRPRPSRDEVVACYRMFVAGLLDVTDNLVGGQVEPPPDVVRHDDDDPYLVVAADKGTATFSDIANGVAADYGFWLGDAFASGGSAGYDHKAMGITARGAWESVRRHFRTLGVDVDSTVIRVVGIGDMSGDVFGNGMLLSPHLQLVAAFDHRHVFLDPSPDPAVSYAERQRLFALAGSSWADYDASLISAGGGVYPRSAKSIPLSAEVRAVLDVDDEALTPNELLKAILRAPVDLLWNGGIGTYVKASTETNADVGDRSNDALRVDGADLRCRVVGEGGNLGLTQRGRAEFALRGGLVNTDAIDNSAGVDCSDHEVNIKIALDRLVADGDLTVKQRNQLLADMTDDVAGLVLEDNVAQNIALAVARAQASAMVDVHARELRALEAEGLLDREIEFLPTDKQLAERQAAAAGLTAPEFAVLLAYTKTTDVAEVLASDLPEDPYLAVELLRYFPRPLAERYPEVLTRHRLRREIIATRVVNEMVNRAGTSFDFRMTEETGASVADVVRAHVVARDVFDVRGGWAAVTALDGAVDGRVQVELWLALRRLAERGVQWLLRHRRPPLDMAATVSAFQPGAAELAERLPSLVGGPFARAVGDAAQRYHASGVPASLATLGACWPLLHTSFDIVEVARARGRSPVEAGAAYWGLVDRLDLAWLWERIGGLPRNDRWQTHARAAVRDDLLAELRALTDDALRAGDVFTSADVLIEAWLASNHRAADRTAAVFADIRSGGTYDLTTLSVALRQLRNLVLSSRPH